MYARCPVLHWRAAELDRILSSPLIVGDNSAKGNQQCQGQSITISQSQSICAVRLIFRVIIRGPIYGACEDYKPGVRPCCWRFVEICVGISLHMTGTRCEWIGCSSGIACELCVCCIELCPEDGGSPSRGGSDQLCKCACVWEVSV